MKKTFLLLCIFIISEDCFSQTDSLTMRDDIYFRYYIRKTLLPAYATLLNFITDASNTANETEDVINLNVRSGKNRIFYDDKVIIESDLKPGADTGKLLRRDQDVIQYLSNFSTGYAKTEEKSIYLNIESISALKKTEYYYYNLLFECNYQGTTSNGERFQPFHRVAEIKLENDSGWHLYFNGIRFSSGNENDSLNLFCCLLASDTTATDIFSKYDNEEQQRLKEQKKKIENLTEEGEDFFAKSDFENSLSKFREAYYINTENRNAKENVAKAREAIRKQIEEKKRKEQLELHIADMTKQAIDLRNHYEFKASKILCDSLINDYRINNNQIQKIADELSRFHASMEAIKREEEKNNLAGAILLCEKKINEAGQELLYRAELYYQLALLNAKKEKPSRKTILDALDKSIENSGKHHQQALMMRATMHAEDKTMMTSALEDATLVINKEPRNPEAYNFRATVYEKDNNPGKAIADYAAAIANKSKNPAVFLKKARLEYKLNKYNDAINTATDGLEVSKCYGMLHFYRGMAYEKTGNFAAAGKDFRTAVYACVLNDSARQAIKTTSDFYIAAGDAFFSGNNVNGAIKEFSKSILIDSSDHALYKRAKSFLIKNMNDSAIVDLDALTRRKPDYRNGYALRGKAFTNMQQYEAAGKDFETAVKKFPDDTAAFYWKGKNEIAQKKYTAAISSLERSALLFPADTVYYWISYAAYYNKDYVKAIENSEKARNKKTTMYEIFYICGRAYYDIHSYTDAVKEFSKAKTLNDYDQNLFFWSAAALEADKNYNAAALDYEKLGKSKTLRDTSLLRAALCLIKINHDESVYRAISLLDQYLSSKDTAIDKSLALAWKAYAHLKTDALPEAERAIEEAKKYNAENPMLQFVQACKYVIAKENERAFPFLDNAMSSKAFTKSDFTDEKMLKPLARNERFKILMEKYFP